MLPFIKTPQFFSVENLFAVRISIVNIRDVSFIDGRGGQI